MLTDDMTRLCGEIVAMRTARGGLMHELQHDTKARNRAVVKLCAHFGRARATMAKRSKNERMAFLNNLKHSVAARQRELRNDLTGARRAWAGKGA
jgi:phage-related minor tail protein